MRMDRYQEESNPSDLKQTRTNKNQELYTDVYLNNVYVDIDNLKEVMKKESEDENTSQENLKIVRENTPPVSLNYEEKNYDIVSIVEDAKNNKKEDNVKRSLDLEVNNQELDNIIESINESQKEKENEKQENLLSDLMPSDENTTLIPPLEEPILDTSLIESAVFETKEEISQDMLDGDITEKDLESDTSFVDSKNNKIKIILLVLFLLLIIGIVIGILFYKNIL